jgi:uncharacterized membrane protein YfcA
MLESQWLALLVCGFMAQTLGTIAGFGAATILTPIATLFIDVKTAIAVVACFHLFGNVWRMFFFWRSIDWSVWAQFGLVGIAASLIGARMTAALSSSILELLLGAFLVVYVLLSLSAASHMKLPKSPPTPLVGGAVSGLISGVIGTGGAIRSLCLLAFGLAPETYLATSGAISLFVDATRVPVYIAQRLIPVSLAVVVAGLVAVSFLGTWLGQWLVRRLPAAAFAKIILLVLFIMGCRFLYTGWRGLGAL